MICVYGPNITILQHRERYIPKMYKIYEDLIN